MWLSEREKVYTRVFVYISSRAIDFYITFPSALKNNKIAEANIMDAVEKFNLSRKIYFKIFANYYLFFFFLFGATLFSHSIS